MYNVIITFQFATSLDGEFIQGSREVSLSRTDINDMSDLPSHRTGHPRQKSRDIARHPRYFMSLLE